MKHLTEFLSFGVILFLLGITGCSKTLAPLAYCAVGSGEACADLREAYKTIRKPTTEQS